MFKILGGKATVAAATPAPATPEPAKPASTN
jgi:hypothetical protein